LLIATPLGLAAGGLAAASALILWACL